MKVLQKITPMLMVGILFNGLIACGGELKQPPISKNIFEPRSDSEGQGAIPPDRTPPSITLLGEPMVMLKVGDDYNDAGATAMDNQQRDLSNIIKIHSTVNTAVAGRYQITYKVRDATHHSAVAYRTVIVE